MNIEKLASFRVDHGNGGYRTLEMTEHEKAARRRFILNVLRDNPSFRLTPEQADDVRIYRMGSALMFEDAEYIEYMIPGGKGGIP